MEVAIDPTRPMNWRSSWHALRKAAGLEGHHFHWLRHQVITELLERGQPDEVERQIVGHVSPEMTKRYAHVRREIKRQALQALAKPNIKCYDTTNVTNDPIPDTEDSQVIENASAAAARMAECTTSDRFNIRV
jgi:Phage integrase family